MNKENNKLGMGLGALLNTNNKNTTSLFLKGRNAINEIDIAAKVYFFEFEKIKSISSDDGCILKINNIRKKNG